MSLIQILLIAFAAFAVVITVVRFRRGATGVSGLVGWLVFWIAVAYVVARPETASAFAHAIGVGRGADAVLYVALVAAFYLIFRLFARIEDIDRRLTKIVREEALKDLPPQHGDL